jgi:drug/metabolite transporter (DMT)-like permease
LGWLLLVSALWAFSFGLIKGNLAGLDSSFVAFARLTLSLLLFAPLLRPRQTDRRRALELMAIGAVQYGAMYSLYIASYAHLQAHEVALFTVTTPLLVVLLEDALERKLRALPLLAALIAVAGAGVIKFRTGEWGDFALGLLLLQAANACFAAGQVLYRRRIGRASAREQAGHYAWLYLGAVIVPGVLTLAKGAWPETLSPTHLWTLAYLGLLPSGLGFYLWNFGATRTTPGVLGVMNNAKVPLGVVISLLVFGESADWTRLLLGGTLVAGAAFLAHRTERRRGSDAATQRRSDVAT